MEHCPYMGKTGVSRAIERLHRERLRLMRCDAIHVCFDRVLMESGIYRGMTGLVMPPSGKVGKASAAPVKAEAASAQVVQNVCILRDDDDGKPSKRRGVQRNVVSGASPQRMTCHLRWRSLHRAENGVRLIHQGGITCHDVRDCPECLSLVVATQ